MQPRYFIGITLPDDLRHAVAKAQHELFVPRRVMEPLKPHITLLHPNVLQTLPPLFFLPKVKTVADANMPFTIKLTQTDMFDRRVLYIAVESPGLTKLQQQLTNLLPEKIRAAYLSERPFTPHITLAQAKPKQKLSDELIAEFKNRLGPQLPQAFTAQHLIQFKWIRPRTYHTAKI